MSNKLCAHASAFLRCHLLFAAATADGGGRQHSTRSRPSSRCPSHRASSPSCDTSPSAPRRLPPPSHPRHSTPLVAITSKNRDRAWRRCGRWGGSRWPST
ncbi:hypothetical protein VPH35_062465 [Triticum aestivum]